MKELFELDATAQAGLVKKGEVSPLELVDAAIARIEEINPKINAEIHKHFDRARAQAKAELPDGPFKGVPFLLKDLGGGNLEGDPIYWGTRFLKNADFRAKSTAYLIDKFLSEGRQWAFISNLDNLAASLEPWIVGLLNRDNVDFLMEVTDRTEVDRKGGTLIVHDGQLDLLEIAQVAPDEKEQFMSIFYDRLCIMYHAAN